MGGGTENSKYAGSMQLYAVNSWWDIEFQTTNKDNSYLSTMYCTKSILLGDNSNSCNIPEDPSLDGNAGFQCEDANNTCQNPPTTTLVPTTFQTSTANFSTMSPSRPPTTDASTTTSLSLYPTTGAPTISYPSMISKAPTGTKSSLKATEQRISISSPTVSPINDDKSVELIVEISSTQRQSSVNVGDQHGPMNTHNANFVFIIIIGVLVLMLVIALAIIYLLWKKKHSDDTGERYHITKFVQLLPFS